MVLCQITGRSGHGVQSMHDMLVGAGDPGVIRQARARSDGLVGSGVELLHGLQGWVDLDPTIER